MFSCTGRQLSCPPIYSFDLIPCPFMLALGHNGEIIGLDIPFSKPGNVSSQEVMSLSIWGKILTGIATALFRLSLSTVLAQPSACC